MVHSERLSRGLCSNKTATKSLLQEGFKYGVQDKVDIIIGLQKISLN